MVRSCERRWWQLSMMNGSVYTELNFKITLAAGFSLQAETPYSKRLA